ncbi:MAG: hypothetical protein DHS20C01_12590 [marine bacterium B5-7]|nr:MAG: hypothetical protein DHS20C01_12590 [marine bacterium B5-7]
MNKHIGMIFTVSVIVASLIATPVFAQSQESWQEKLNRQLRNENVTRAIGSVAGALLGTQIGGGSGKIAAIAVGTLAGYWLGGKFSESLNNADRVGIAGATERAIQSGQTTSWSNPDTGTRTRVMVKDEPYVNRSRSSNKLASLDQLPPIEFANSYYEPTVNINVRGGPNTDYQILHTLKKGTSVPVIGRVVDSNWLLIANNGTADGFVYGPLMELTDDTDQVGNAVRDSMDKGLSSERYQVVDSTCRKVTQEVMLKDGAKDTHSFTVCRQNDGNWVEV